MRGSTRLTGISGLVIIAAGLFGCDLLGRDDAPAGTPCCVAHRFHTRGVRLLFDGFVLALVACLLSACDASPSSGPTDDLTLTGSAWVLQTFVSANGGVGASEFSGHYTLAFDEEGGASAQADCNNCGGTYEVGEENALSVSLICTRVACHRSAEFSGALNVANRFAFRNGRLLIFYRGVADDKRKVLIFRSAAERRE